MFLYPYTAAAIQVYLCQLRQMDTVLGLVGVQVIGVAGEEAVVGGFGAAVTMLLLCSYLGA